MFGTQRESPNVESPHGEGSKKRAGGELVGSRRGERSNGRARGRGDAWRCTGESPHQHSRLRQLRTVSHVLLPTSGEVLPRSRSSPCRGVPRVLSKLRSSIGERRLSAPSSQLFRAHSYSPFGVLSIPSSSSFLFSFFSSARFLYVKPGGISPRS